MSDSTRIKFLEHENAEILERMAQMQVAIDALGLRITELLGRENKAPQVTVQPPQVTVQAPEINLPAADKSGAWEITVPGINGSPARTVTMKRTA